MLGERAVQAVAHEQVDGASACCACMCRGHTGLPAAITAPAPRHNQAQAMQSLIYADCARSPAEETVANPVVAKAKVPPPTAKVPFLLPCGHTFCEPCVMEWLSTHDTCPGAHQNVAPRICRGP